MKWRLPAFILAAAFIIPFLAGCSFKIRQVETIMRPPKIQGKYSGLQEALEKAVGKDILLKSPETGNYRSAFILQNIDDDDTEEALAFYVKNDEKTTVHLNVLDLTDDEWVSVNDVSGSGDSVYFVDFINMDDRNGPEIIVGWSLFEGKSNKMLTVFSTTETGGGLSVKAVSSEAFTIMKPLDLDSDGCDEILTVITDTSSDVPRSFARMLKMLPDGTIKLAGETRLDGNVGSYGSVQTEKVSDKYPLRVYIDANKGETQMITEVIYWDSEKKMLVAPLLDSLTLLNLRTWRSVGIPSSDINNDGVIEIPAQVDESKALTEENILFEPAHFYTLKWLQLNEHGEAKDVLLSAVDFSLSYMFVIPDKLLNSVTMKSYTDNNRWDVFSTDSGGLLFTIDAFTDKESPGRTGIYEKYTVLRKNSGITIFCGVTELGKSLGINDKFLLPYVLFLKEV